MKVLWVALAVALLAGMGAGLARVICPTASHPQLALLPSVGPPFCRSVSPGLRSL